MSNRSIIEDFIEINNIKSSNNYNLNFWFDAEITFNTETLEDEIIKSKVYISKDNNEIKVNILDVPSTNIYPMGFTTKHQTFELSETILNIYGTHTKKPIIGDFDINIKFLNNTKP
ncbi:hypothetical protein HX089_16555 [Myroides odoratimimus]|uniref:hypothetical protein n=1 Tax=Myroides odoratimimus TaxID=76832 RepID=UPI002575060D|nr:hypothetical protein [Myroides odoratimimus]MDM1507509.1 hypothetical protein [Myroides odoratimimus]MDM1517975.1 hypothetical protein [Myroides odoratimimus]